MATVLVDELVRAGVRHVVLCPGSRSAPLAYAAQAAERAGRLTLHVRVDERSAGFLALGLAKLTRVPAVVITTSGTAVANLHPAVLEAHHGVVPLIVLSADRPVELRGTGANQTTVQPGMYAGAVRWSLDAVAPQRLPGEVARWRGLAAAAVRHATGTGSGAGEPGPVHLNLQLREPLVPTDEDPWPEALDATSVAPEERSQHGVVDRADAGAAGVEGVEGVEDVARTLVLVGDLPEPGQFEQAVRWAASRGWPVLAEPFGTHPRPGVLAHGPLVLSDPGWLDEHAPDRVIAVGRLTLSRPVAALLRRPGVRVEAVGVHGWIESRPDIHVVHPVSVLDARPPTERPHHERPTTSAPTPSAPTTDGSADESRQWSRAWRAAGERVASALADQSGELLPWPSGPAVAEVVAEQPAARRDVVPRVVQLGP